MTIISSWAYLNGEVSDSISKRYLAANTSIQIDCIASGTALQTCFLHVTISDINDGTNVTEAGKSHIIPSLHLPTLTPSVFPRSDESNACILSWHGHVKKRLWPDPRRQFHNWCPEYWYEWSLYPMRPDSLLPYSSNGSVCSGASISCFISHTLVSLDCDILPLSIVDTSSSTSSRLLFFTIQTNALLIRQPFDSSDRHCSLQWHRCM